MCRADGRPWGRLIGLAAGLAMVSGAVSAGTITGGLAFPGDNIPALTVVAVEQSSGKQYSVETKPGQRSSKPDAKPRMALLRILGIVSVAFAQDLLVPEFVQRASIVEVKARLNAAVQDDSRDRLAVRMVEYVAAA